MKQYISIVILLLLCGFSYGQTSNDFNPDNPPEPQAQYTLTLQAFPASGGTVSGGGKYGNGAKVSVNAYTQTGFRFDGWYDSNGEVVSNSASFRYVMGNKQTTLTARFIYDPSNPDEPTQQKLKHILTLVSEPASGGNIGGATNGGRYREGDAIYMYASPNTGFKFSEWKMGEQTLSTNSSYTHTMGAENQEIKAIFYYDPSNPNEPDKPTGQEYALITLTTQASPNMRVVYPVYLLSRSIDITTVSFDIQFPENVPVDYESSTLATNRSNGHTMTITPSEGVTNGYHVDVSGSNLLQGEEGVLVYIPITIPEAWENHESHPVTLTNALIDGSLALPVRNGAVTSFIDDGQLNIRANFYTDAFFNRIQFRNLSSDEEAGFLWNFGDGTTSTEKNPFHVFASSGDYTVKLTASNEYGEDVMQLKVSVPEKESWKLSGTLSLDKDAEGTKSFKDVAELFTFMNTGSIIGDMIIQVKEGQSFDIPMSVEINNTLQSLTQKLVTGNHLLNLNSDGGVSTINFSGTPNPEYFKSIMDLGKQLKHNNISISIFNIPVDITAIYKIKEQVICSGENMAEVNLKTISQGLTFNWKATDIGGAISGYTAEGTDVIPQAVLQNSTTEADSLIYQIDVQAAGVTLYTCAYKVVVLPGLIGTLDGLFPANGEEQESTTVRFLWKNITNSVYDLYLWESGTVMPSTPIISDLKNFSYESQDYCKYGTSYEWKVVARNKCSTLESEIGTFAIRHLPDLHIYNVKADSKVYSGKTLVVTWSVKNDGQGITLPENWKEQIWLVPDLKTKRLLDNGYLLEEVTNLYSLGKDESYEQTRTVVIPEKAEGNYYLLITSGIRDLQTIDFSQTKDSIPEVYTPDISGDPYFYLKAISYNQTLLEETGVNLTDNFFFRKITIKPSPRPDLIVEEVRVPEEAVEKGEFSIQATIVNRGDTAVIGKTWEDYLYRSKKNKFDNSAILLTKAVHNGDLEVEGSYVTDFSTTTPVDSLGIYYYYVKADGNDKVVESNENNNIEVSRSLKVMPYMMEESEYVILCKLYENTGGKEWYNKWQIDSRRIVDNKWHGVEFNEGHVTNIILPENNLKGQLPKEIFELPDLESLYLSYNSLYGRLDTLFDGIKASDSLKTIYLTSNNLEGMIPISVANFSNLEYLELYGNHFDAIEDILPSSLSLYLCNQILERTDSVELCKIQELDIPSIARYNHSAQAFNDHPEYKVFLNDKYNLVQELQYDEEYGYKWNDKDWVFPSGTKFILQQWDGDASGTTSYLKVCFKQGDANMDRMVDVLDVQHSLNYIFKESPKPFNWVAANTYKKDSLITVQDIVSTVNIILNSETISSVKQMKIRNQRLPLADNVMSLKNRYLVLETEQPVAAMDVVLKGISGKQLRLLLDDSSFQMLARDTEDGVRFILFSPTGDIIPAGYNEILELNDAHVTIVEAELSDREARRLPINIYGTPTDTYNILPDRIKIQLSSDAIIYTLPSHVEAVNASLYTPQGILVAYKEYINAGAGKYRLEYPFVDRQGAYILQLTILSNGRKLTKNFKLIISK